MPACMGSSRVGANSVVGPNNTSGECRTRTQHRTWIPPREMSMWSARRRFRHPRTGGRIESDGQGTAHALRRQGRCTVAADMKLWILLLAPWQAGGIGDCGHRGCTAIPTVWAGLAGGTTVPRTGSHDGGMQFVGTRSGAACGGQGSIVRKPPTSCPMTATQNRFAETFQPGNSEEALLFVDPRRRIVMIGYVGCLRRCVRLDLRND